MLSFSTPSDDNMVVGMLACDWVLSLPLNQPALVPPHQGRLKGHRGEKRAMALPETAQRYWASPSIGISRTHPLHGMEFFADPKVQACLKFKELVEQWRTERGATSSITAMAMCDAYQKIIGIGPDAVPLIIAQMKSEGDEPDQWFWALQVLTGVDPVAAEDRGDLVNMSQAWIKWAENEGYGW